MRADSLRPGISHGLYPERRELQAGWLEQMLVKLATAVVHPEAGRRAILQRIVEEVARRGRVLSQAGDGGLREEGQALRRQLHREGLAEALIIRAFALARELADRHIGQRHFDTQLMGGWVMMHGMLAEMETGEGKTLTTVLPACTAALAGIPVHVMTSNDYLVQRDAAAMAPVYHALGLTVGVITEGLAAEARRAAYACDITYGTSKQFAFDYLRDRLVLGRDGNRLRLKLEGLHDTAPNRERLLLRGLCFALVDEADSLLIDEARTPLVIASPGHNSDQPRTYQDALRLAGQLRLESEFQIDGQDHSVRLTERGRTRLAELAAPLGGVWVGERRREEQVCLALSALHLFVRDRHYLVKDGKIQIIDENTGRLMADRSWGQGLHQMIESKEVCPVSSRNETLAQINFQRFFRRYLRLAGATGTAAEVAGELRAVYGLSVARIPTRRPSRRHGLGVHLYRSEADKWMAVLARAREGMAQGRPVLVGTCSVAASELLSARLAAAGVSCQLLNARQNQDEAARIARAGEAGRVTVATNMAGRGTDIPLGPEVAARGGLYVIASEPNEARRIDRQLFGRCARQGDPGSYELVCSLEDALFVRHCPALIRRWLALLVHGQPLTGGWARWLVSRVQCRVERHQRRLRAEMLKQDQRLGELLGFSGRPD